MGYHQNLLNQILKCTPDCVFTLDRDWHFSFLNVRAVQTLGGSRPLLRLHVLDAFPLLRETGIWAAYERAMDRHIPQSLKTLIPGAAPPHEGAVLAEQGKAETHLPSNHP